MLTQTQNKSKLKHFGISAIMKNKKLSAVIDEAMKSSPGSTKRAKAVAMIKSLNRVADGMGGPITNATQIPWLANNNVSANSTKISPIATPVVNPVTPKNASQLSPELMTKYYGTQPTKTGPTNIFPAAPIKSTPTISTTPSTSSGLDTATIDKYQGLTGQMPSGTGTDVSNFIDQWYEKLDVKDKEKYKFLKESVQAGIGADTFAIQVQTDKNKLKSLFPDVPESELPEGASLARQVDNLDQVLRKEYQVDVLQDNVKKLEERGVTIKQDLNDYIASRDEYLTKVDTMIDGAKESMAKMDLANPYISSRMNKYMNYLYILKGRQQKRYTDYLNDSINQDTLKLSTAKDNYNTIYKQYEDKLKTQTAITTEDYTNMKKMLEDMYTNLDERESKLYDLGIKSENYIQEQYNTVKTVNDALDSDSGQIDLSDAQKVSSQSNYFSANPKATASDWNNLSYEEKIRWSTKEKNLTEGQRTIIGGIEALKKDGAQISEIEEYITLKGYKPTDFWDYYKGYVPSEAKKKWYESDWVGKIPFVK